MALGDINVRVNTAVATIGRVRVPLSGVNVASQLPITLKNSIGDIPTMEQIRNVNVITETGHEVPVFNSNTNNFDIRILTSSDVSGVSTTNIDCGSF